MTHYVCPICGGVSEYPGVCKTSGCVHAGHDLVACDCTDSLHAPALKKCEKCGSLCKGNCAVEPYREELSA